MNHLDSLSLLAYGYDPADPDDDLGLHGRDRDRVRLVKRISTSPGGIYLPTLVSECVKGQYVRQCKRFGESDPDYQFAYRFLNDLDGRNLQPIEKCQSSGMTTVTPIVRLLDLISEGITRTAREHNDLLYDRHFCENYLKIADKIDDWGRNLLEGSLHRYLRRIKNYQLLFDIHFCR